MLVPNKTLKIRFLLYTADKHTVSSLVTVYWWGFYVFHVSFYVFTGFSPIGPQKEQVSLTLALFVRRLPKPPCEEYPYKHL